MFPTSKSLTFASVLLLSACAVTRVDAPPPAAAPIAFKENGLWQHGAVTAAPVVPDAWWTLFRDPVLDALQQRLMIGNENLKASVAQVASARATLAASRSAMFPTLSAGFSGTRSGNPQTNGVSSSSAVQNPSNSLSLSANASWEIDLWGRLAQASSGAQASLQASSNDLAAATLSAQALLAQTYFSLRAAEAQQALYARSVAAYQRSLDLTQVRYQAGVAGRSDVLQAQTQLKSAQAQALESVAQRAQLEHAIAVLLGQPPSSFSIVRNEQLPTPPAVPELLPASLLERRPDIAAAKARVSVAYAQIGIADAAFFPSLTLSANAGYRNSSLANLVSAPNLFWSLGPSLAASIFDGGQRKLASAQARNSADVATSSYRQAVLTALQEVEDNLVLADQLQQEAALQAEASESAQRTLEITLDQYRAGTVGYLNVAAAQSAALNSEISLLSVRNRQLAAVNQLLKNIAGRWTPA
jgi:NodT family efflux transporter outer membrane factor (OMF) lipoprotein